MNKSKLLSQVEIVPELEKLEMPYRFMLYDHNQTNAEEISKQLGLKKEQLIKTLIVTSIDIKYLILIPYTREIAWGKLNKFIGKNDLKMLPKEKVKEVSGYEPGTVPPVGSEYRIYADMSMMKNQFLAFGSGVSGVALILDKNDIVNKLQVTLGYFSKPRNDKK